MQWQSPDSFQLIISFHHACLDGWSLAAVITEILQDYSAQLRGGALSLAAPQAVYRDFVALERRTSGAPEARQFWKDKINNYEPALLPRWPQGDCGGGTEQKRGPELTIEADLFQSLKQVAQRAGVPLKTVLLAAHLRVMGTLYGRDDVTSGLICNGRPEAVDGEKLVGLFLNALPVHLSLAGGTWLDLIQQAFHAEREMLPHRRFPLAEIHKLNGGQPLFETAFDFVHFHVYKNLQGCSELDFQEGHYFEANDLTTYTTFMLDVTSTQLQVHLDYDPNRVARAQVEEISAYYVRTLQAIAADPGGRYECFSPLSQAEHWRVVLDWNATAVDYPRTRCLHELFRERALQQPETTALVFEGQQLTYRELEERSNLLAQRLQTLGVGPEMRGGHLPGAVRGPGSGPAGHPQGRRGLCAARPSLSAGTSGLYLGRCRCRRAD